MEPRAGLEPAIKALQTYALPLGDRGKVRVRQLPLSCDGTKVTVWGVTLSAGAR
jgi:hypothetical protein